MSMIRIFAARTAAAPAFTAARAFSTTQLVRKSPVETAKDAVKTVDRTISDAAVKGIEKGQEAAKAAQETVGVGASEAKAKGEELAGEAKGKAHELKGEAKGKTAEIKGKM